MIHDENPPHPWPDTTLANLVRAVNVLTALYGLVLSIVAGIFLLFLGILLVVTFFGAGAGIAMLALLPVFYWGCGGYGAAFTRFERFPVPRLIFQTLMMGAMLTAGTLKFLKAPDLASPASSWEIFHTLLSIFSILVLFIALVAHLASLAALLYFRRNHGGPEPGGRPAAAGSFLNPPAKH